MLMLMDLKDKKRNMILLYWQVIGILMMSPSNVQKDINLKV